MGFSGLLGNDSVKNRLEQAAASGKLSHSYIIAGPKGSGKKTLAKLIAAAMQCTAERDKPCLTCNQCRKVLDGTHPDVIVVDDREKKTVSVAQARWAKTDLYIRPNEGKKKIYLFPRAQDMNPAAQNALLKVMEEPPAYGAFLLLANRPESVLPTVRSRCVELALTPVERRWALPYLKSKFPEESEERLLEALDSAGGFLGQTESLLRAGETLDERAMALCQAFAASDRMALTATLCKMEKLKRDQLIPILRQTQTLMAQAMTAKAGRAVPEAAKSLSGSKTASRLLAAYEVLKQAAEAAEANVGVGHICGFLAVRLR